MARMSRVPSFSKRMKIINAPALHRDTRARAVRERDARFHVAINLGDDRAVKVFPARTFRRETHVLRETRYATIGRQLFDPYLVISRWRMRRIREKVFFSDDCVRLDATFSVWSSAISLFASLRIEKNSSFLSSLNKNRLWNRLIVSVVGKLSDSWHDFAKGGSVLHRWVKYGDARGWCISENMQLARLPQGALRYSLLSRARENHWEIIQKYSRNIRQGMEKRGTLKRKGERERERERERDSFVPVFSKSPRSNFGILLESNLANFLARPYSRDALTLKRVGIKWWETHPPGSKTLSSFLL